MEGREFDDFFEASGDFDTPTRKAKPRWDKAKRSEVVVKSVSPAEVRAHAQAVGLEAHGEAVMRLLFDYRVMYGEHLRQMVYGARSDASMRKHGYTLMANLRRHGFVEKVLMPDKRAVYVLGDVGRAWVRWTEQLRYEPHDQVAILGTRGSKVQHDVLISQFCVPLVLDLDEIGGSWYWTNRGTPDREGFKTVMWDAYLDLHLFGWHRHAFLEIDRGTETLNQWFEKVYRYINYFKEGDWKGRLMYSHFPSVWVITSGGEQRIEGLKEATTWPTDQTVKKIAWRFTSFERIRNAGYINPLAGGVWDSISSGIYTTLLNYSERLGRAAQKWQEISERAKASTNRAEQTTLRAEADRLVAVYSKLKLRAGGQPSSPPQS